MTPTEIRQLRESCDLTQAQMAKLIGTRQKDISRWERGVIKVGPKWRFVLTDLRDNLDDPEVRKRITDAFWS